MKRTLFIILLLLFCSNANYGQTWTNVGSGLNWNVYDLITYNDTLYAAGRLGLPSRGVFYWNGTEWVNTAYFWGISYPLTLAENNNELYTGGGPDWNAGDPTKVYKWTGVNWEQQGDDFNGSSNNTVQRLISHNGYLYAGGQFEIADGDSCKNIARWNGSNWEPVFDGVPGLITEMDVFNGNLIVNHSITDTVQITDTTFTVLYRQKLQSLGTTQWMDLDSIFQLQNINLVGVIEDKLYFSTNDTVNGIPINGLGIWDGIAFSSIGNDLFRSVSDIEQLNGELYISCELKTGVDWIWEDQVLKRVGNSWTAVGGVFDNSLLKLHVHDADLYTAGFFEEYDNEEMFYVSKLYKGPDAIDEVDYNSFSAFPNPFNHYVAISSEASPMSEINLYSIKGELIKTWRVNSLFQINLDLAFLPKGVYNFAVTTEQGIKSRKLIKN